MLWTMKLVDEVFVARTIFGRRACEYCGTMMEFTRRHFAKHQRFCSLSCKSKFAYEQKNSIVLKRGLALKREADANQKRQQEEVERYLNPQKSTGCTSTSKSLSSPAASQKSEPSLLRLRRRRRALGKA